jgi:hypothetical protein
LIDPLRIRAVALRGENVNTPNSPSSRRPCKNYQLELAPNEDVEHAPTGERRATCTLLERLEESARIELCAAMGFTNTGTKCPFDQDTQQTCRYYAPKPYGRHERTP